MGAMTRVSTTFNAQMLGPIQILFRHEYDVERHIETLIIRPNRPFIPCSHLCDEDNF